MPTCAKCGATDKWEYFQCDKCGVIVCNAEGWGTYCRDCNSGTMKKI